MKPYKSVKQRSEAEYTVNRSRFIGRCFPVDSEEAALCLLGDIRKKHWDATHNCFAYRIGDNAAARFSDDGEPGGTAGKPIMDVLTGRGLTNVLCVVTRYFGGILLGAGGLVRAYSKSAAEAVAKAGVVSYLPGTVLDIKVAPGQNVAKGDVLFVLEAMKMENEILAAHDGVIASVNVQKSSSVNSGDVLGSYK